MVRKSVREDDLRILSVKGVLKWNSRIDLVVLDGKADS